MKPYGLHRPSSEHCHFPCSVIMVQRKLCQLIQNHTKALFLPYTSMGINICVFMPYTHLHMCMLIQPMTKTQIQGSSSTPTGSLVAPCNQFPTEVTPTLLVFDFIYMVLYITYSFVSGFFPSQYLSVRFIHGCISFSLLCTIFCMNVSQFTYSSCCR